MDNTKDYIQSYVNGLTSEDKEKLLDIAIRALEADYHYEVAGVWPHEVMEVIHNQFMHRSAKIIKLAELTGRSHRFCAFLHDFY